MNVNSTLRFEPSFRLEAFLDPSMLEVVNKLLWRWHSVGAYCEILFNWRLGVSGKAHRTIETGGLMASAGHSYASSVNQAQLHVDELLSEPYSHASSQ